MDQGRTLGRIGHFSPEALDVNLCFCQPSHLPQAVPELGLRFEGGGLQEKIAAFFN